jgi:hypothetical protein
MRGIRWNDFRPITRALSVQKKVSANTVLCIKHNFQLKLVCTPTFQAIGYKKMMQPTQVIFQGQWTQKKGKVQFSLDDLCTSTYTMSQKLCVLYVRCTLSVLQKEWRKVWGARYT